MPVASAQPVVTSPDMPEGVALRPRRFVFDDLDAVPRYWFAGNPMLTHFENAFSIMIPPGERFFVRSVRNYLDRLPEAEARELLEAFAQQEELHSAAHEELNASFARFGVDIEREAAYAERVFQRLSRILPDWAQLGITAFSEHLTAVGAHFMLHDPQFREWLDPRMHELWSWHAAEELEHKAVAFDLFERFAGGYLRRVLCAVLTAVLLLGPNMAIFARLVRDDPHEPTRAERRQARRVHLRLAGPQLRMIGRYFRPGFHPWQVDDTAALRDWYRTAGAQPV
jgi:predicted metal-dependent hydrolase